jgi:hypothetical protein
MLVPDANGVRAFPRTAPNAASRSVATMVWPGAAGAAAMSFSDGHRMLDWIWIHPYERGRRLMPIAWADLEATYGADFLVRGPLAPAMRSFLTGRASDRARWQKQQD